MCTVAHVQKETTRLERLRGERGMTQEDLAAASGVSRVTIYRYEKRGIVPGRYVTRHRLATALETTVEALFEDAVA